MSKIKIISTKDARHAPEIHNVLFEAFNPYAPQYTEGALNATIVNTNELVRRISSDTYEVMVAFCEDEIAGTASVIKQGEKNLYLLSMAVKPTHYGKGIGRMLLEEVEKAAVRKGCVTISLETSTPLLNAIALYEKFGFAKTGSQRDYYGVTIFEMVKNISI